MSNTQRHKPYTGSSTDYEVTIAADNAAPTALTDANVTFAPSTGISSAQNRIGPSKVMIKGRFTGSAAASADVIVALYLWDPDANTGSGAWHCTNAVPIVGSDGRPSLTKGMMGIVDCDPNCRAGYLRVVGLAANQAIELMVTKVQ